VVEVAVLGGDQVLHGLDRGLPPGLVATEIGVHRGRVVHDDHEIRLLEGAVVLRGTLSTRGRGLFRAADEGEAHTAEKAELNPEPLPRTEQRQSLHLSNLFMPWEC